MPLVGGDDGSGAEVLDDAPNRPKLIAVTVLTSMGPEDLNELGIHG